MTMASLALALLQDLDQPRDDRVDAMSAQSPPRPPTCVICTCRVGIALADQVPSCPRFGLAVQIVKYPTRDEVNSDQGVGPHFDAGFLTFVSPSLSDRFITFKLKLFTKSSRWYTVRLAMR